MGQKLRAGLLGLLALLAGPLHAQAPPVAITFLDVGQGDAVLIRAPGGRTALIDSGPGIDIVSPLRTLGVDTLDLVIASHPHADHIGGMLQVLRSFPVRFYMDNGRSHTTTTYSAVMETLRSREEITYLEATPRSIGLGPVNLRILPLPRRQGSNLNDSSVGLVLEYGEFLAFLSGDSERTELMHWVRQRVVPDVKLLKAPHHGSDDAISDLFLQAAQPELVVISVGFGNRYGHPGPQALHSYGQYAQQLLRTDTHGEVSILGYADGSYEVHPGEMSVVSAGGNGDRELGTTPDTSAEVGGRTGARSKVTELAVTVFADAPGNDHQNTNGEYAILSNPSPAAIDLSGWTLCDEARHCFTFPQGATLEGAGRIVLFTGLGVDAGNQFYWGSGSAIWNNRGDTAYLYDAAGQLIIRHVY